MYVLNAYTKPIIKACRLERTFQETACNSNRTFLRMAYDSDGDF